MDIIVRGHKLEGDFMDADFIEKCEDCATKYAQRAAAAKTRTYSRVSEMYRVIAADIETFFDELFGAGTGEKVFYDCRGNVQKHLSAIDELYAARDAQIKEMNDMMNTVTQKTTSKDAKKQRDASGKFVSMQGHKKKGSK